MTARDLSTQLQSLVDGFVPAIAPGAQLSIWICGAAYHVWAGNEGDERAEAIGPGTRFDLASLTKLVVATTFMRLVEDGRVGLDDAIDAVIPEARGNGRAVGSPTWRHVVAHASGLPATIDLTGFRSVSEARAAVVQIRPVSPAGQVVYSDVGYMVIGIAIERLTGMDLRVAVQEHVVGPIGATSLEYGPVVGPVAATEWCLWRGRRLRGEVHDEAASVLGGTAGHAGLFGSAPDVLRLGATFLGQPPSLLAPETLHEMCMVQASTDDHRRGLGFALWSPDPEAPSHPLGRRAFGHTGFTGCSLWIDPDARVVVALLTNAVYRGRDMSAFEVARRALHARVSALSTEGGCS